jgi:two-component system chemotaxis response regulator CheY
MITDENTYILIADDMATTRQFIIRLLKDLGYSNFVEAADGDEAWRKARKLGSTLKVILCDWNMPKGNGLDFLKKVKEDERLKTVPFIMVTGETDFEHTTAALLSGADGYVTKPFDVHVLRFALNQALGLSDGNSRNSVIAEGTVMFKKSGT